MLTALRRIHKNYMTTDQLRKDCIFTNDYEETLGMSYENIQSEAKNASKGIKFIEIHAENEMGTIKPM
jgi:hypothetical protein